MNFFQKLFGAKEEDPVEKKKADDARNFDILKDDGMRALHAGEAEYAIKCFRHALEIHDDMEIHDGLSEALIRQGNLPEAFEELRKLAEAHPENQEVLIRMARVAFMMEDYGAMGDACEKALLIDKSVPEVSYLYARASRGQGDDVNAVALATRAISLDANYADAYLLRGKTLLAMGDVKGAADDAAWLAGKAPDNEDVLLFEAQVEHAQGHDKEALECYDRAIQGNPFCLEAYRERGALRLATGDKDGAAADAVKVVELNPKETEGVNGKFSAKGTE